MKRFLAALLIVGMGAFSAYAGGFMLLHVGEADGSGTTPLLPVNTSIAYIGDSEIFIGDSDTPGVNHVMSNYGMTSWASFFSKGVLLQNSISNKGIGGQTSTQIAARYATDTAGYTGIILNGCINDLITSTPLATIQANYIAMFALAASAHQVLFIAPCLPSTSVTGGNETNRLAFNAWLLTQALPGKIYPTSVPAGYTTGGSTTDGTHTNAIGAEQVGTVLGPAITSAVTANASILFTSATDPLNFLPNGFMQGTSGICVGCVGGSVVAGNGTFGDAATYLLDTGGAGGATITASVVPRTGGGNWQQIAVSGTYSGTTKFTQFFLPNAVSTPGLSTASLVDNFCDVQVDPGAVGLAGFQILNQLSDGGSNIYTTQSLNPGSTSTSITNAAAAGVIRPVPSKESTATPTFNTFNVFIYLVDAASPASASFTIRIGACGMRKLSLLEPLNDNAPISEWAVA